MKLFRLKIFWKPCVLGNCLSSNKNNLFSNISSFIPIIWYSGSNHLILRPLLLLLLFCFFFVFTETKVLCSSRFYVYNQCSLKRKIFYRVEKVFVRCQVIYSLEYTKSEILGNIWWVVEVNIDIYRIIIHFVVCSIFSLWAV